jgi:crotonobetainyl-CoA:carnitine CoA-transferase CaiB-like acyl-CoA transferase
MTHKPSDQQLNTSTSLLEGIKVLDLSRILAGPWASQVLADFGATVWKIKRLGGKDGSGIGRLPALDDEAAELGLVAYRLVAIGVTLTYTRMGG